MTANIDANNHNHVHDHGEVGESDEVVVVVANNVGEQCCDSDVVDVLPKINGNKDDVEGSYVFVTGHDDVDDLVESDLVNANGNKLGVEEGLAVSQSQLEEKDKADRQTEASGSRADELNSRLSQEVYDLDTDAKNSDELGVADGVEKDQESEIAVDNDENNNINNNVSSDNKDREVEKVEALSNEIPMKASGDDQEQECPSKVSSLESEIKLDMAIEEIPICGDIGNGFPDGSKEQNLETTLNSGTRNVLETEAANGPVFEQQNGEGLPADIAHESLLEISVVTQIKGSPTDLDNEKPLSLSEEAPFEGSKGETGDVLEEHNLETTLSSGDDKALEAEVANSPSLEQSGEDLPPGLPQESLLETAVVTEQNVSPTDLDNEKSLNLSEEAPVEGPIGETGDDLEEHNLETPLNSGGDEVANGPLLEQNGEDLPERSLLETAIVSEQNGSPTALDQENPLSLSGESPVEVSKGDVVEVLKEHSLETPSSSGGDKAFEMEVANGPSLEENEEHLPSGLAQESLLETAVITEQNGSSENAEGLTSPLVCSDVALETGQSLSDVPVKDIIGSLDAEDVRPENDTGELNQQSIKSLDDSCPITNDPELNGPANGVMAGPEFCSASNGGEEVVSADAIDVESTVIETSPEFGANQHIIFGTSIELQSKVDDVIALKDKDTGVVADGDFDFECIGSDVKSASQEAEDIEGKQVDEASRSSQEKLGETVDGDRKDEPSTALPESTSEGQNAGVEEVKKRLYYFIRIPWYDDEKLREQIKCAELQVEERTKIRGAIHAKVQTQRAIVKEYADKVQASLTEERAARDLFKSKRQEFDSVQLVISKVKNAQSVEDIHAKIRSLEHLIEHETLPLKEEKQLIREIKQLKQQRDQLSSNMGKQDEVQQALDQKDQIEERLKGLRKELDLLREKLSKAEEVTQTAKKKLNVENDKLNELLYQFRDADSIRQEAYAHFKSLRDRHSEKIERFKGYKNASTAALKLALSKDKEQLQHCIDQVEKLMEVWNRDDDFRKDYIRSNTRSTLRRLGTLDGRSLGPDEEPPVMPDVVVNNRAAKNNSVSLTKITEQEKQDVPTRVEKPDDKSGAKVVERKNQMVKTMKPAKPAPSLGTSPVAISDKDERKEEEREEEEPRRSKEEEELARRAEELRKEEEEANLKLQRHLEERAKAKEAMERKKKIADKAQAKAAFRAQKDAEEKEKKREKRAQKKERKKANGTEPRNEDEGGECAPDPSSEGPSTGAEPESEKPAAATTVKRPQKAQQFTKQIRTRSVAVPPPLLRNRGKRRMQPWMWVALAIAVAIVLALFLSWPSCMHWFGF